MKHESVCAYRAIVRPCSVRKGFFRWDAISLDGLHSERSFESYISPVAAQAAGDRRAKELTAKRYAPHIH
jgi:hypothetical protein